MIHIFCLSLIYRSKQRNVNRSMFCHWLFNSVARLLKTAFRFYFYLQNGNFLFTRCWTNLSLMFAAYFDVAVARAIDLGRT